MTEPTKWPALHRLPGWEGLYRRLQRDVAELDPFARVSVRVKCGGLNLHVHAVDDAVQQQVRDLCFDVEADSMLTCQVCGGDGQLHRDGRGWIRALCDEHAEMDRAELEVALAREDRYVCLSRVIEADEYEVDS